MPSRLYTLTEVKEWLQPASAFFEWLTVMSPHDADLRRQVQRANQWMRQPAHRALQADEELWAELSLWNDANPYGTIADAEPYYRQWCISITSIHIEIEAYAIADPAIGPPAPQSFWYSTCFTQQPSADGMLYSAYIGDPLTVFLEDALHCHRYHTTTRHRWDIHFDFSIGQA